MLNINAPHFLLHIIIQANNVLYHKCYIIYLCYHLLENFLNLFCMLASISVTPSLVSDRVCSCIPVFLTTRSINLTICAYTFFWCTEILLCYMSSYVRMCRTLLNEEFLVRKKDMVFLASKSKKYSGTVPD